MMNAIGRDIYQGALFYSSSDNFLNDRLLLHFNCDDNVDTEYHCLIITQRLGPLTICVLYNGCRRSLSAWWTENDCVCWYTIELELVLLSCAVMCQRGLCNTRGLLVTNGLLKRHTLLYTQSTKTILLLVGGVC